MRLMPRWDLHKYIVITMRVRCTLCIDGLDFLHWITLVLHDSAIELWVCGNQALVQIIHGQDPDSWQTVSLRPEPPAEALSL